MSTVCQLSVFLENKPGRLGLHNVVNTLDEENIHIITMNIDNNSEYDVIRLCVSDPEKGYSQLLANGFNVCITSTNGIIKDVVDTTEGNMLKAWKKNEQLFVSGLIPGRVWRVYNVMGKLVHQSVAVSDKENISLEFENVYIVQSDNLTTRVSNI